MAGKPNGARILIFDIETAPILGWCWSLWQNDIGLNQIESDWHLLSWAAKWLHDPPSKIMYEDQRKAKDIQKDKRLLRGIWKLLDRADIVITQNGIRFDVKKLNARFILNGMKPPSPFRHIDTCKIARTKFGFTSNKLEYLTENLCTKYKKLAEHKKFPGFKLWSECIKGNLKAWKEMERYNKYDVLSLEELYYVLEPWGNKINFNVFTDEAKPLCNCGKTMVKNGYDYTNIGKFQRFWCKTGCGSRAKGKQNLLSKKKRKSLMVKL